MSRRVLIATFAGEEDLLGAARTARARGLVIVDVYTPYAVHGLDEAMGLPPSRLSRACLACGILGVAFAFWFQYWSTAVDWPINVGGRPWNSWPAFVPVAFELMVLFAGLGVVAAFLLVSRLFPGKCAVGPGPGVTSNQFVLVLEESNAAFDASAVRRLFQKYRALEIEEQEQPDMQAADSRRADAAGARRADAATLAVSGRRLNILLLLGFLAAVGVNWFIGTDHSRPNLEFLPEMVHSVPYDSFAPNPNFADEKTLQTPVEGTIPRGHLPLHYRATPEDAVRAGKELHNPFPADDPKARQRGLWVYTNYCLVCHGPAGKGDGLVTQRGVPPPPSYLAEKAMKMSDGEIFHILTFGQGNMASYAGQIAREDRWRVILHVRALQKPASIQANGKGQP